MGGTIGSSKFEPRDFCTIHFADEAVSGMWFCIMLYTKLSLNQVPVKLCDDISGCAQHLWIVQAYGVGGREGEGRVCATVSDRIFLEEETKSLFLSSQMNLPELHLFCCLDEIKTIKYASALKIWNGIYCYKKFKSEFKYRRDWKVQDISPYLCQLWKFYICPGSINIREQI